MHFLSEKEIDTLEVKGEGVYGTAYLIDDVIIKKYHKTVRDCDFSFRYKNPCLRYRRKKFYLLMMRNNKIYHTSLIDDVVFVKNRFVGVVYPYIEGRNLDVLVSKSLLLKRDICYQLIRNANELTDFCIYPLDYKFNNILYDIDCNVRIIDLDDLFTKVTLVKNPVYLYRSICSLRRTVIQFLEDNEDCNYNDYHLGLDKFQFASQLSKKIFFSYQDLKDYVNLRCQSLNCIFVDCTNIGELSNIDFSFLKKIQEFTFTKIVLCITDQKCQSIYLYDYKKTIIQVFQQQLIDIYDILVVSNQASECVINHYLQQNNIIRFLILKCPEYQERIDIDLCVNFFKQEHDKSKILIKS